MQLTANSQVQFVHWKDDRGQTPRETEAILTMQRDTGEDAAEFTYIGIATCNPQDNYSRALGRKLALARAMKQAQLSKETRTQMWRALWSRVRRD